MSFLNKLAKNETLMNKAMDMGSKMMGEKFGIKPTGATSTAHANEDWHAQGGKGKKKALFVGINYFGTKAELRGCINDVKNIRQFIIEKCGFPQESTITLTDDQQGKFAPTKENIVNAMRWLVQDAQPGDSIFFHYSGHGSRQQDTNGDEGDGYDETICPVDYESAGMISDDEMNAMMVKPLPAGVKFVSIYDCCHSGSILDLPFTYTIDGHLEIVEVDNRVAAAKKMMKAGMDYFQGKKSDAMRGVIDGIKVLTTKEQQGGAVSKEKMEEAVTKADVVQFSGCMDTQTSADACIDQQHTGAMSHAFIKAMEKYNFQITFQQLLKEIREILHNKYSQVPQMSAGRRLRMDVPFTL